MGKFLFLEFSTKNDNSEKNSKTNSKKATLCEYRPRCPECLHNYAVHFNMCTMSKIEKNHSLVNPHTMSSSLQ